MFFGIAIYLLVLAAFSAVIGTLSPVIGGVFFFAGLIFLVICCAEDIRDQF